MREYMSHRPNLLALIGRHGKAVGIIVSICFIRRIVDKLLQDVKCNGTLQDEAAVKHKMCCIVNAVLFEQAPSKDKKLEKH